jgi:hypothetical protein
MPNPHWMQINADTKNKLNRPAALWCSHDFQGPSRSSCTEIQAYRVCGRLDDDEALLHVHHNCLVKLLQHAHGCGVFRRNKYTTVAQWSYLRRQPNIRAGIHRSIGGVSHNKPEHVPQHG